MDRNVIRAILGVQVVSATLFIIHVVFSIFGVGRMAWVVHEITEISAAIGLVLGTGLGMVALRRSQRRAEEAERKLHAASSAFMDVVEDRFRAWRLSPAERDVALFAIKGLSTAEIAALRETSEGTVKAQTAAVYRKAGATGRPQLLSLFIEDLMAGPQSRETAMRSGGLPWVVRRTSSLPGSLPRTVDGKADQLRSRATPDPRS